MAGGQTILDGLLVLNVVLAATLILGMVRSRARRVKATNLAEAFTGLELALKEAVPDLPAGFTWGEAFARLRSSGLETREMETALTGYEEYRYGGSPLPDVDFREVVKVANALGGIKNASGGAALGR